ncbi:P2X purinoceptor 4 [Fasciola gigantica]|uniref:P2X purinoceptor 4 n=1 Tax=Fasciola gigantica TaxID=46835 RepID=A0A504YTM4_FASGI|nr:P2X purinoceptor 4 [Fasciola gigantica]
MGRGLAMLFEYETPKLVQISNLKIGVAHRIIQLIILIYVVCWVLMYEKAYQYNDEAKCAVTTKVKGVGFTDAENIPGIGKRSWDIADYIIPPLENNAFFVATNLIVTPKQKLGKCAEHIHVPGTSCASDNDCNPKEIVHIGNGVHTGHCLLEPGKPEGVCEIHSWCPLENDSLPLGPKTYMFPMVQNYTLLIKNDITFEKFGVHRRNILPWSSKRFLRSCTYDKNHEEYKYCPIFKLSTIFEEAGVDPSIFIWGGVIGIDIQWDCDLDWDVKYCNPIYSFSRLDDANAKIASGFNFRYANFYYSNGTLHRDLIKAYGIRFIIHAHGKAGKFNIIPLTMNIGSGLALLGLVSSNNLRHYCAQYTPFKKNLSKSQI